MTTVALCGIDASVDMTMRELEHSLDSVENRVSALERATVNVEKISFSGRQLIAIAGFAIVMAGGMWTLTRGIDDLRDTIEAGSKLQDERNDNQNKAIQDVRQQLELRRLEIQRVSEMLQSMPQGAALLRR